MSAIRRYAAAATVIAVVGVLTPISNRLQAHAQPPVPPIVYDAPDIHYANIGDLFLIGPDGSGPQPIILTQLVDPELPVWSRDGRWLSASSARSGGSAQKDLWVFDSGGGNLRDVTNLTTPTIPCGTGTQPLSPAAQAFSRDSTQLVYTLQEFCTDPVTQIHYQDYAVYVSTIATGAKDLVGVGIIGGFDGVGIDWSPAATALNPIVLPESGVNLVSGEPQTALFVGPAMPNTLSSFVQLTAPPGALGFTVNDLYPAYSPNGAQVAFVRYVTNVGVIPNQTTATIWIVNADGSNPHSVGPDFSNGLITHLSWSPDGTTLLFDRGAWLPINQGSLGLWTMNAVTGLGLTQIWPLQAWAPSWAPVVPPFGPAAVLPALSNGAYGGYLTTEYVQNIGNAPATISISYSSNSGNAAGAGDAIVNLPPNATWTVRQNNGLSFSPGAAGSGVMVSNQPVAVFVNEFPPSATADATSYSGVQLPYGTSTMLYAPAIANGAYGGYTTGIGLLNKGDFPTNVTIVYSDASGNPVKTQTLTGVPAHSYQALYSGDPAIGLPAQFAGTATLTSSSGPIGAVINETGPGGQLSSYDAVPSGSTTLFAPAALDNAYGGYFTGMGIQNTIGLPGTVIITYYDSTGTVVATTSHAIPASGYLAVYQGTDLSTPGAYTAKITSTVAVAAIVNEVAPSGTAAKQSTAYNMFVGGSGAVHLPLVESAGPDGWSTGEGIMNTGAASTTVTVTYYDTSTGAPIGTPDTQTLQPDAFWGLYQPAGGLPNGLKASAVITTTGGGQVAVICNESSPTTFMSYSGQ